MRVANQINQFIIVAVIFCIATSLPKNSIAQFVEDRNYFTKVEIPARFIHGMQSWFNAVERNFDFTSLPKNESNEYRNISIRFTVSNTGKINSIYYIVGDKQLLNTVSNMLMKSGRWLPGLQSGRNVNSYRDLRISFRFNKENNKWEFVREAGDYLMRKPAIPTKNEIIANQK